MHRNCSRTPREAAILVTILALASLSVVAQAGEGSDTKLGQAASDLERGGDPALIRGVSLPDLIGRPVEELFVFRYEADIQAFVPIPFQIDERQPRTFNAGRQDEFTETVYDVWGEEDVIFDEDDELAFLFGDAGDRAPTASLWPEGADDLRIQLALTDPRPGSGQVRWAYVFSGQGLAESFESYVSWDGQPTTSIVTDRYALDYIDRWLLTGFRVFSPCGSGADLIDRFKGRAEIPPFEEDEAIWNSTSFYQGGYAGPVRGIRYVRGATSGINTLHHDVVYRDRWRRTLNLRVHPIAQVRLYFDWLPQSGATFYSPSAPSGVPIDGVDDGLDPSFVDWNLVSTPGGGIALFLEIPPSPYYHSKSAYHLDDSTHDDALFSSYSDEDDSAYGNHGWTLDIISDTSVDPIVMRSIAFPLCADEGDANLAHAYEEVLDVPLSLDADPQWRLGPVRSLQAGPDGPDLILSWQVIPGAVGYRIMRSTDPSLPRESWLELTETTETTYTDRGAILEPESYSYQIVVVGPAGEEFW